MLGWWKLISGFLLTVIQLALKYCFKLHIFVITIRKYRISAFQRTVNELLTPPELGDMTLQTPSQIRKIKQNPRSVVLQIPANQSKSVRWWQWLPCKKSIKLRKHSIWFVYLYLELELHIWCGESTGKYSIHTEYEDLTPSITGQTTYSSQTPTVQ